MTLKIVAIIALAAAAVVAWATSRVRGLSRRERTTVERRSGVERRRRQVPVAVNRRRRARRTEDVARRYVEKLSS